jgi:geranylgeranyl transferase type-1 subunit beta
VYHAYLGLAALAIMGEPTLKGFDAALCVSSETVRKIQRARKGQLDACKRQGSATSRDPFWADKAARWPDDEKLDVTTADAVRLALEGVV